MFIDPVLQEEFQRTGFVVVDLLAAAEAAELLDRLTRLEAVAPDWPAGGDATLRQSFFHPDPTYRAEVDTLGRAALTEALARLISGYRILAAGHFIKGPDTPAMNLHRDWTIVRNLETPSLNVWCPLMPVDERNGTLAVVPGSQALPNVESAGVSRFYAKYGETLKRRGERPSLQAGQAIIFDNRLMHWSTPNETGAPRHVLRGICMPEDERVVFYRLEVEAGGRRFEVLDVEDGGVLTGIPDDLELGVIQKKSLGYVPNLNRPLTLSQCERLLRHRKEGRPRRPMTGLRRWVSNLAG
ncbi:MAG TPA: phytanoyl-CoA dioxygenase family protein [Allosphingosinicella sp.]|jgi:hypothetical protein